jgi:virginiamycin A acetyltransferase
MEAMFASSWRSPEAGVRLLSRLSWSYWPVDVITEHVATIWTGTPAELEQAAKDAGLLD